ncbi:MAG: ATP-grasp domain-containing protein [Planctomycetia bacterium]|nr:ATP-grasp domain-containing protein [Planctomycetia bacterium]
MQIFVFEFTTGGGLFEAPGDSAADFTALAVEGAAMVAAVASDFATLPGTQVSILRDACHTLPLMQGVRSIKVASQAYLAAFDREAAAADWTIVIAPECDGLLAAHVERVLAHGGRVLGPGPAIVRLCSDKQATAEHLAAAGVPVPKGGVWSHDEKPPRSLLYPLVAKPRDGAGSVGVRLLRTPSDHDGSPNGLRSARVEEFRPGLAASVALLCGPGRIVTLPPCRQKLSDDGRFKYLGGELPLAPHLARRATRWAAQAVATLGAPRGYIGVDLVLGAEPSGHDDVVIEINPRLTTSFVGLRAAARGNLAAAMLDVATGREPALSFTLDRIEFTPDGRVWTEART